MTICICPDNGQEVPSNKRMLVIEPGAVRREGSVTIKDASKVHIFNKDCPVHGYRVVEEEEGKPID